MSEQNVTEPSEGASTSVAMPSDRRFACRGQNCGKTFKSMSSRSNHMKKCAEALKTSPKKLAKKKGERFSCRFCNKGFNSRSSCYRHKKESCAASSLFRGEPVKLKKKKGKSEFPCRHCSRVFDRSKKLEKHIEVKHTDRTLYNCCNCGRDFRRNDFFQKHLQICQGSNELPTFVEFRRNTDMTSENSTDPHSVVEEVIYNADSSCDDLQLIESPLLKKWKIMQGALMMKIIEGENSLEFSCAIDEETYHVGRPCEEDYV